eukprot:g20290.t1
MLKKSVSVSLAENGFTVDKKEALSGRNQFPSPLQKTVHRSGLWPLQAMLPCVAFSGSEVSRVSISLFARILLSCKDNSGKKSNEGKSRIGSKREGRTARGQQSQEGSSMGGLCSQDATRSSAASEAAEPTDATTTTTTTTTSTSAQPEQLLARWEARPKRTGSYFVAHSSLLPELQYEDKVDIYQEFLSLHPNCDARADGFVMLRLSAEQITAQRDRIRMASYRWQEVQGVGPKASHCIPKNYGWFLEHIKEHKQIGWLDFLANVGVNVAVPEVLDYMGGLYASLCVLGDWTQSAQRLQEALKRGWIFQETAFCDLDPVGVEAFCGAVRTMGLKARDRKDKSALQSYLTLCADFSQLLTRRQFSRAYLESKVLTKIPVFNTHLHMGWDMETWTSISEPLRLSLPGSESSLAFYLVVWLFGMEEGKTYDFKTNIMGMPLPDPMSFDYTFALREFVPLVCRAPLVANAEDFFKAFAFSIYLAYFTTNLTVETDRISAITAVARDTLTHKHNVQLSPADFFARLWRTDATDMRLGRPVPQLAVPLFRGVTAPIFSSLDLAGTIVRLRIPDHAHKLDGSPDPVVEWSFQGTDQKTHVCRMVPGAPTEERDLASFFHSAVNGVGLSGISASQDGKEPPSGILRHSQLGCAVELYYCVALKLHHQGCAFVMVVSAEPAAEGRVVGFAKDSPSTKASLYPARDTVF